MKFYKAKVEYKVLPSKPFWLIEYEYPNGERYIVKRSGNNGKPVTLPYATIKEALVAEKHSWQPLTIKEW